MSEMTKYAQNELATNDLVDAWLEFVRQEGRSKATRAAYRRGLGIFQDWLAQNGQPDPVLPEHVRQFKADLAETYSAQTVNLRLSAIRSFYRWMVVTGRLPVNPAHQVRGVKRSQSKTHKRDALTDGEVRALLDSCQTGTLAGTQQKAMLTLFAYCGLRTIEMQRANIGDLRTLGDRLVLWVQGKGRREADEYVVIPVRQETVIRAWLAQRVTFADHSGGAALFVSLSNRNRGQRLTTRAIRGMVKDKMLDTGAVGRKSTHSLRHTTITSAIKGGATPMQVQSMARHQSFDTTLGYFHEQARIENPAEDLVDFG